MGKALYRKYRSRKLSEIVGQEHITNTLSNALKNNQISHAYLFTGPRGVGKTSVARILAHEINNLPYEEDDNYLDIIEIDAASNRKIDEIRQLRDKVNLAPVSSKYKVYIIDEVHMLTREAFNALLKTLEEPPEHVIFILATTEANKVPETITSRTQLFNFRPIAARQMIGQLKNIAKIEKIDIDEASLNIIAEYGQGSFRDSISLLDQVSSFDEKVTSQKLESILGMAPESLVKNIVDAINKSSNQDILKLINEIYDNGYSISIICKQLLLELRVLLINNNSNLSSKAVMELMKELIDIPASQDPETSLEIALISACMQSSGSVDIKTDSEVIVEEKILSIKETPKQVEKLKEEKTKSKVQSLSVGSDQVNDIWLNVLEILKNKHNTLYGIARMAVPEFSEENLTLKTKFAFHEKSLSLAKNKKIISDILSEITGGPINVICIVDQEITYIDKPIEEVDNPITAISNIFGGAEVVE